MSEFHFAPFVAGRFSRRAAVGATQGGLCLPA